MAHALELEEPDVQEAFFERGGRAAHPGARAGAARRGRARRRGGAGDGARAQAVGVGRRGRCQRRHGRLPEYFPIVAAGAAALLDPAYNANTARTSTGGTAICVVVSGPLAAGVGMNAGPNVLGQGNRANATIGRALRLVAINLLDARPGAHAMEPEADGRYSTVRSPEDVFLVTGAGAGWSAYIPCWAPKLNSRAVPRKVQA